MQSTVTDIAGELESRLVGLWRLSRRTGDPELSRTASAVLATLRDEGPRRITELAASESVAQPTMTSLVTRLERLELVQRGPDPGDARAVLVALTPAGRSRLERMRAARIAALEERLASLHPDERAAIDAALPALHSLISGGQP